jgi:hypothetical protein
VFDGLEAMTAWIAAVQQGPSYEAAAPAFEDRMWGPKKPIPEN